MFKSILVLESPWEPNSVQSVSVWPFVSEFARVSRIDAYHQYFFDKNSFRHWVTQYNRERIRSPKLLYVAAHGSKRRLAGLRRQINLETISQVLKKSKQIKYVHFGSCLFGNEGNLETLFNSVKHLQWIAGYDKSIDWVDATAFDILLWNRLISRDKTTKGLKTQTFANSLVKEAQGLVDNLGFQFAYRYGKSAYLV